MFDFMAECLKADIEELILQSYEVEQHGPV